MKRRKFTNEEKVKILEEGYLIDNLLEGRLWKKNLNKIKNEENN